jgi:DNA-directed RNA polymerase subunit RPC12/RpoP
MQVETVACNNCGAPLEVGLGTNYVTCAHCGSRLTVKRAPTSVYTELLEKLDHKTDAMARQLAQIAYQNELWRIDREWEQEREGYLTTDKRGNKSEPTTAGALFGGVILIGFGLFSAVTAGSIGAPFIFPLAGLLFAGFGVYLLLFGPARARQFQQAREAYRRRRAAVTADRFLPRDGEPPVNSQ